MQLRRLPALLGRMGRLWAARQHSGSQGHLCCCFLGSRALTKGNHSPQVHPSHEAGNVEHQQALHAGRQRHRPAVAQHLRGRPGVSAGAHGTWSRGSASRAACTPRRIRRVPGKRQHEQHTKWAATCSTWSRLPNTVHRLIMPEPAASKASGLTCSFWSRSLMAWPCTMSAPPTTVYLRGCTPGGEGGGWVNEGLKGLGKHRGPGSAPPTAVCLRSKEGASQCTAA